MMTRTRSADDESVARRFIVQRATLVGAALSALIVGATAITPLVALALPAAPLAPPACAQWGFEGPVTIDSVDDEGHAYSINFTGGGSQVDTGTKYGGYSVFDTGHIRGNINDRGFVFLQVFGGADTEGTTYAGSIADDRTAHGTYIYNGTSTLPWHTTTPVKCMTPAAGPSPAGSTATVTRDATEWDAPDGKGKAFKDNSGHDRFVAAHTQVQLLEPCRDDWCHVKVPDGGRAVWLYAKGYLTEP